jgi:rhamnosyltransferase
VPRITSRSLNVADRDDIGGAPLHSKAMRNTPVDAGRADVVAVIVSYHPDPQALSHLVDTLGRQTGAVVVVDNASPRLPALPPAVQLIRLPHNQGVAAAQNAGLQAAQRMGAHFALLLDQDSVPAADMTDQLLAAWRSATAQGLRVGAVGPRIVDPQGRSEGFVVFGRGRYQALPADERQDWMRCDMLIASGTLLPLDVLAAVGPMAEPLFIDKVDTEWSLRAASHGYQLLGAPRALLHHRLGLRERRLWFFGWRRLAQHAPFRYYYMVRNGLLLRRLPHAHAAWRRADLRQLLSLLLYFGVLAPGRLANLRMMWRGLLDGRRGLSGPLR